MTKRGGVEVHGADELADSLDDLADDLDDLDAAGAAAGRVLQDEARRHAPRRTGALAASIVVDVDAHGRLVTVSAGNGAVRYAGVQEFGWRKRNIRPHWFMRNAFETKTDKVVDVYASDVDDSVNNVRGA